MMTRLSSLALAAGLAMLAGCGGGGEQNAAVNGAGDELYNVAPDDLGAENLTGNDTLGNDLIGNEASGAPTDLGNDAGDATTNAQ